jgi:hypothetical protein
MHAKGFLHKLLSPVIHKSRLNALSEVVQAAICTKQLTLSGLGRAIALPIQERSGIQKVNRLLANNNLLLERKIIATELAKLIIGNKIRPEIIVDWSKYPNSQDGVMRASLSTEGRAITLYEERWPFKYMGGKRRQGLFLKGLKEILPENCQPIIITDAGFHNFWFKDILKLDWDYIGRIRNVKKYQKKGSTAFKQTRTLFRLATNVPQSLGKMQLTEENPLDCCFYLMKASLKGRKALRKDGRVRKDKDSKAYSRAYREPWLLVSSLTGRYAAKRVMKMYKRRMTIEEAFRDLKSSKYGLGLEQGMTRRKQRRDILLLVAMLACFIAWLSGKIGEAKRIQYHFQSNSIKTRRVLSLFYLGCQMIRKKVSISPAELWDAATSLRSEVVYE